MRHIPVALWIPRPACKPGHLEESQDLLGLLTFGGFHFHIDDDLKNLHLPSEKVSSFAVMTWMKDVSMAQAGGCGHALGNLQVVFFW